MQPPPTSRLIDLAAVQLWRCSLLINMYCKCCANDQVVEVPEIDAQHIVLAVLVRQTELVAQCSTTTISNGRIHRKQADVVPLAGKMRTSMIAVALVGLLCVANAAEAQTASGKKLMLFFYSQC